MAAEQPVETVIHFWESRLDDRRLLCFTTVVMIEDTIRKLKRLKKIEGVNLNEDRGHDLAEGQ